MDKLSLLELRNDGSDPRVSQISLVLLQRFNIKRFTPSKRWSSVEEFNEFVKVEAAVIESEIRDSLIMLGWTPPQESKAVTDSTKIEAFLRWMALQKCYKLINSSSEDKRTCREFYKGCGFFYLKLCPACRAYILQHGE